METLTRNRPCQSHGWMGYSDTTGTTSIKISMRQEWSVSLKTSYWGRLMGMRSLGKVVERNKPYKTGAKFCQV